MDDAGLDSGLDLNPWMLSLSHPGCATTRGISLYRGASGGIAETNGGNRGGGDVARPGASAALTGHVHYVGITAGKGRAGALRLNTGTHGIIVARLLGDPSIKRLATFTPSLY
ncbi:hypothetical protein BDZ89DRAFT_1141933 [Hymenopellis radicata]|nr:hypothetical protein BDZ89DRAFT_1141933 [Hymenopellis radicata]